MTIRPLTRIPILSFPPAPPDPNKLGEWANAITDTINRGLTQQAEAFTPRFQFVKKPTNEIRSNTAVLAPDSDLTVSVAASATYLIEGRVFFESSGTADFQFSFGGPAAPTAVRIFHEAHAPGAGALSAIGVDVAYAVASPVLGAASQGGYVHFVALVQNGATAGLFTFNWAQNTAHALTNTIVLAGSYLTFHQL